MTRVTSSEIISAGHALRTLIHQFSDPLSFYRELVQNALDAGSRQVEIQVRYSDDGQTEITVEDSGIGMTEEIIDSQLTCLFSSRKDDDLTLIGKFGIGFVSVFALDSELVTLETARDGEAWTIDFFRDGSFERRPLKEVREGTKIRLLKTTSREEFESIKARSREVLTYWCKHVHGEILFCGEHLESPFGIDVDCPLIFREPDTEIQLGYAKDFQPFIGFYNQGLTLLESTTEHTFAGLVVKINSRFLEHTLTRDQVVQDEHFAQLMSRVGEMAETDLPERLFAELESRDTNRDPVCAALSTHYGARPLRSLDSNDLSHPRGEAAGLGLWVGRPGEHAQGLLCDGPALEDLGPLERCEAVFRMRTPSDAYTDGELEVAGILVSALGTPGTLAQRELRVKDFQTTSEWTEFVLEWSYDRTQRLDFRVDWKGQVPLVIGGIQVREPTTRKADWSPSQLASASFRTVQGTKVSLSSVLEAHKQGRLTVATSNTALSEQAEHSGFTVLQMDVGGAEYSLLKLVTGSTPPCLRDRYVMPEVIDTEVPRALRDHLKTLAQALNLALRDVRLGRSCCGQDWPALLVDEIGRLELRSEANRPPQRSSTIQKKILVLNAEHPAVERVVAIVDEQAALAAYLLLKHFLCQSGVSADRDTALALAAWGQIKS